MVPSLHQWNPAVRTGLLLAASLLTITSGALRGETVGNPIVNRSEIDSAAGAIFVELHGFAEAGEVSSFAFYNDDPGTAGRQLTPLLFEQVGNEFVIRGVGASVENAATGIQNFAFQLAEGSNLVEPGWFFGYKNGTDADPTTVGIIEFDYVSGAPSERFFGTGFSGNLDPGVNLGEGTFLGPNIGQIERVYSVSATSVPEPASGCVLAIGALSLLAFRRCRVG